MDNLDRQEMCLRLARSQIDIALGNIKLARSARKATATMERFGMTLNASMLASADVGEFDNRAHDWLRAPVR